MSFERIELQQAKELIEARNANVADIRDALSFQAGHIKDSTRIDNSNLAEFLNATDKTLPLIVCCYHGNASQGAAQFLAGEGFNEVYSLDGGYEMWKLAYPELCEQPSN